MLSAEDNRLLTETGPGTPCGRFLRRYWQPVALSDDIPAAGATLPVTVFGEELVLYRRTDGTPAVVGRRCPHRGTDLGYGRVEDDGIRCIYHGWLFAPDGRCLQQPGEPDGNDFCHKVKLTAYPCAERGGLVFAYLGGDAPPAFPRFDFLDTEPHERAVLKVHHACNYLQGVEGNMDQAHLSFLHRLSENAVRDTYMAEKARGSVDSATSLLARDPAPSIVNEETGFGFREITSRSAGDGVYVKVENYAFPGFCAVPGPTQADRGYLVNWHVPIDDRSHWKYMIVFREGGGLDRDNVRDVLIGDSPIRPDGGVTRLPDGRHRQDRTEMAAGESFAGLGSAFAYHDLVVVEAQGEIVDRSAEHLGLEDRSLIMLRSVLKAAIARAGQPPARDLRDYDDMLVIAEVVPAGTAPRDVVHARLRERDPAAGDTAGSPPHRPERKGAT